MVPLYLFQPLGTHTDVDVITQGLLGRGRRPQLQQQQGYGYLANIRAG
jgi:hypothetical protein